MAGGGGSVWCSQGRPCPVTLDLNLTPGETLGPEWPRSLEPGLHLSFLGTQV